MVNHQTLAKEKIDAESTKYKTKMPDIYNLKLGVTHKVIKEFTDFDRIIHKPGESWIFIDTNYLPYESGLTLNVIENGKKITYRFQDEPDP